MEKRILLDAKDFDTLVGGKILKKDEVKIALEDIGYDLMSEIISEKRSQLFK